MRSFLSGWNFIRRVRPEIRTNRRNRARRRGTGRRLRMENLEDRQMLSTTWTVTWDHDEFEPNTDADGQRSLREAIVRDEPGDMIKFDSSLAGHTISLDPGLGEIAFSKSLTIDGGNMGITIDANDPTPMGQPGDVMGDGHAHLRHHRPNIRLLAAAGDDDRADTHGRGYFQLRRCDLFGGIAYAPKMHDHVELREPRRRRFLACGGWRLDSPDTARHRELGLRRRFDGRRKYRRQWRRRCLSNRLTE